MIDRRGFLLVSGAALLVPFTAESQPAGSVHRIGYLQTASPDEQALLTRAFVEGLRELGYVDGANVVVVQRYAWGKQEKLPELAADLVRQNVDVIVTGGNIVIAAVQRATTTIPVVMGTSRDPVGSGFVASLARPGGNITGLTGDPTPEVQAKRLELLREALPTASRVALLRNPLAPEVATYVSVVERAAAGLGVRLTVVDARRRDDFEGAFASMSKDRADAVIVVPDPVFFTARAQVVALAARHRIPAIYHAREMVEVGGLMSYGTSLADQFRRAAAYVDRILKGARPGDLPVEQATRLELVINERTAGALGLAIPQSLLLKADDVLR